jgi:hypothetical protein
MEIRFVSSLSDKDEEALAAFLGAALSAFLDETSLNYALRIETSGKRVYHRQKRHAPEDSHANAKDRIRPILIPS